MIRCVLCGLEGVTAWQAHRCKPVEAARDEFIGMARGAPEAASDILADARQKAALSGGRSGALIAPRGECEYCDRRREAVAASVRLHRGKG